MITVTLFFTHTISSPPRLVITQQRHFSYPLVNLAYDILSNTYRLACLGYLLRVIAYHADLPLLAIPSLDLPPRERCCVLSSSR